MQTRETGNTLRARWVKEEPEAVQSIPCHQAGPFPGSQGARTVWRVPRDLPVWSQGSGEPVKDGDQESNMRSFAPEAVVRVLTQSASI